MKKLVSVLLLVFVSLVNGCGTSSTKKQEATFTQKEESPTDLLIGSQDTQIETVNISQEDAVHAIERLGGEVEYEKSGKLRMASLSSYKTTNSDLVYLKGLTDLRILWLIGSSITDDGLLHLQGLIKLQSLTLTATQINGNGLVYLKRMADLEILDLKGTLVSDEVLVHLKVLHNLKLLVLLETKITDKGLVHLKGMTGLRELSLHGTKVTDAGVKELKAALPKCWIRWRPNKRRK